MFGQVEACYYSQVYRGNKMHPDCILTVCNFEDETVPALDINTSACPDTADFLFYFFNHPPQIWKLSISDAKNHFHKVSGDAEIVKQQPSLS